MLRFVTGTILPTGIVSSLRGGNQTIPTLLCWLSSSCHSLSAAATVWVRTWPCLSSRWCCLPPSPLRSIRSFLTLSPYCLLPRLPPCFLIHAPPPTLSISGRRCQLAREVWSAVACLSDCSSDTGLGAASAALQLWAGGPWSKIRTLPHLQAQGCPAPRQSSLGYVICSNSIAQICSDWYWGIISLQVLDEKIELVQVERSRSVVYCQIIILFCVGSASAVQAWSNYPIIIWWSK